MIPNYAIKATGFEAHYFSANFYCYTIGFKNDPSFDVKLLRQPNSLLWNLG